MAKMMRSRLRKSASDSNAVLRISALLQASRMALTSRLPAATVLSSFTDSWACSEASFKFLNTLAIELKLLLSIKPAMMHMLRQSTPFMFQSACKTSLASVTPNHWPVETRSPLLQTVLPSLSSSQAS